MTHPNVQAEAETRETKRADELGVGDWLAVDNDFGSGMRFHDQFDTPALVRAVVPFGSAVHLVLAANDVDDPIGIPAHGDRPITLASDADVAEAKRNAKSFKIADELRDFAQMVEALPLTLPLPKYALSIDIRPQPALTLEELRDLAARLDINVENTYGRSFEAVWPKGRLSYEDGIRVTWTATGPAETETAS